MLRYNIKIWRIMGKIFVISTRNFCPP